MRQMFCYTPESKGAQTSAQEKNQCKVRGAHSEVVAANPVLPSRPLQEGEPQGAHGYQGVCVCREGGHA